MYGVSKTIPFCSVVFCVVTAVSKLDFVRHVIKEIPKKWRPVQRTSSSDLTESVFSPQPPSRLLMDCTDAVQVKYILMVRDSTCDRQLYYTH
jgi:hypothetical protein